MLQLGRQLAAQSLLAAAVAYPETVLMPAAYLSRLATRAPSVADRKALEAARTALLVRAGPVRCSLVFLLLSRVLVLPGFLVLVVGTVLVWRQDDQVGDQG